MYRVDWRQQIVGTQISSLVWSPMCKSIPEYHAGEHRKVLILGGTGRVGASTASALLRKCPDAEIILASRSTKSYEAAVKKRPELANAKVKTSHGAYDMLKVKKLAHKDKRSSPKLCSSSGCMLWD